MSSGQFSFPERHDIGTIQFIYGVSPVKRRPTDRDRDGGDIATALEFWQKNLERFSLYKKRLRFSAKEVEREFAVEVYNETYGAKEEYIPGHLGAILDELMKKEEVLTSDVLGAWYRANTSQVSSSSSGEGPSLPMTLLSNLGKGLLFGVSSFTASVFVAPQTTTGEAGKASSVSSTGEQRGFMSVALLNSLQSVVLALARKRESHNLVFFGNSTGRASDDTLSFSSFLREVAVQEACGEEMRTLIANLSEDDVQLFSYFMMRSGSLVEAASSKGGSSRSANRIVKIVVSSSASSSASASALLAPEEVSRLTLRASIANIDRLLEQTKAEMDACVAKAQRHSRDKQKALGLYELEKHRRALERQDNLSQRYMILDRALDSIQQGIDNVEMNRVVQEAYISAASGLRSIAKQSDVTVESFEDARDAFEEELDKMNELNEVVGRLADLGVEEREELERQFDELMSSSTSAPPPTSSSPAPVTSAPTINLPNVPSTTVVVVEQTGTGPARVASLA